MKNKHLSWYDSRIVVYNFLKFKLSLWFLITQVLSKMSDAASKFVDEFFSARKSYKICFFFSLIAWCLQILALGTQNWLNVKNSSVGLWIHCNYSVKDFKCCQPLDDFLRHSYTIYRLPGKYKFISYYQVNNINNL